METLDIIYSPEIYAAAEKLLEKGGILEVNLLEKGLYNVFVLDEGTIFDVELNKPFTKKFASTCTCDFHTINGHCSHTLSALMQINKEQEAKNIDRPKANKLKLSELLGEVPHDELVKFIRSYASKDRKLNIALKVHFAKYADLENNAEKYKAILDSVIRPVTTKNQKLPQSEWITFKAICVDLLDQTEDLIVMNGADEAVDIISAVIKKLAYIQNAFGKNTLELINILKSYHLVLNDLITDVTSVKLLDKIKDVLINLMDTSFYSCSVPQYHAGELIFKNKFLSTEALHNIIVNKIKSSSNDTEIHLLYSLKFRLDKTNTDFASIPSAHLVYLEKIVDDLIIHKENQLALQLLYHYHNTKVRNPLTIKLAKILIEHSENTKLEELTELFISTKDLRIVEYVQNYHKEIIESFIKSVENSSNFNQFSESITFPYFLAKTKQYDKLLEHLTLNKSFELLKNFDKEINDIRPIPLALLYTSMVDHYLKEHIGEASNLFIDQLINHLTQIKAKNAIKHIKHLINDHYSNRFGLLEM
ncbi:MAG TPA: hypothetical protein PKD85_09680 [Saprospiraceae bacterium]|nr:hypothetical protein [Saprospiraceae bacterium]